MSDRLLLYNKDTDKYVVFAKSFGNGYQLGNVDHLMKFLDESDYWEEIIIGDLDILDEGAEDIKGEDNTWTLYPPEKHIEYIQAIKDINDVLRAKRGQ